MTILWTCSRAKRSIEQKSSVFLLVTWRSALALFRQFYKSMGLYAGQPRGITMHGIRITDEKMTFSAAHFVVRGGVCERLHGHNYQVEVAIQGTLDDHGMVMDFRDIKDRVGGICDTLDHRVLLPGRSREIKVIEAAGTIEVVVTRRRYLFPKDDCVVLPIAATTAELLAEYIATKLELAAAYDCQVCVSEKAGSDGCYGSE